MDELPALRELRRDVEPAPPRQLATLRAGLLRSMHAPQPRRGFGVSKLVWRTALAGGLAVAMLVGLTVTQGPDDAPIRSPLQPAPANAAVFLNRAADKVAQQPDQQEPIKDGQWVYILDLGSNKTQDEAGKERVDVTKQEFWFSVDGADFAGRIGKNGIDRFPVLQSDRKGYWYPARVRDFQAKLPLDPAALLAVVHAEVKRMYPKNPELQHGVGLNNRTVWLISTLLGADVGVLPSPKLQAALYRALAEVPGVKVTQNVTDLAGRNAVVLEHTWSWYHTGIVLDPKTYDYLGFSAELKDGKVYAGSARLRVGIVDQPGQLP